MRDILEKLYPTAYYKRVFDIPLNVLKKKGVKGLVFDIDNTLSPYDCPEPDEETLSFIKMAADDGFSVCLLSNNTKKRVSRYNEKLGVHTVHRANKPLTSGLRRAMALMGTDNGSTVLIGDQIFTDVWCGNRCGVKTVLVAPCSVKKDFWMTKIKRRLERAIIKRYLESRKKR